MLRRTFTTVAEFGESYSKPLQVLHWIGAFGMGSCVGTALAAQQIDPEKSSKEKRELRGKLMWFHESMGMTMLAAMIPRVGVRWADAMANRIPPPMPGTSVEHLLAKASHSLLYAILIFMPVSGLAFGYASGWGVPFWGWNVPGCSKEDAERPINKKIEGFFYENHHRVGQVLEYLLPIHVVGAFYHLFRGHNIVRRMNPFAKVVKDL